MHFMLFYLFCIKNDTRPWQAAASNFHINRSAIPLWTKALNYTLRLHNCILFRVYFQCYGRPFREQNVMIDLCSVYKKMDRRVKSSPTGSIVERKWVDKTPYTHTESGDEHPKILFMDRRALFHSTPRDEREQSIWAKCTKGKYTALIKETGWSGLYVNLHLCTAEATRDKNGIFSMEWYGVARGSTVFIHNTVFFWKYWEKM